MVSHPSPNFNERKMPISMIVLHYTALPSCEDALDVLCDGDPARPSGRVSAHYLVDLDGTIFQMVDETKRAWHAGVGAWRDVRDVNSASIGIEIQNVGLDGNGRRVPFPAAQIKAVTELCKDIQYRHSIRNENIVGHCDVAPARKQDPGEGFPWRLLAEAGVGLWTDQFAEPDLPTDKMLALIGYDVSDLDKALVAFRRHWYPEAITANAGNTIGRIASVWELVRREMQKVKWQEKTRARKSFV